MKHLLGLCTLVLALACQPSFALSPAGESSLRQIQTRWAEINYQRPAAQREAAFARLASEAESAVVGEPQAAELHIWHGIVLSTWAGAKGGLGALGLVKQAKAELEKAIELDRRHSTARPIPAWPASTIRCPAGRSALVTRTRPRRCSSRR
jgi:hypothetical protein